MHEYEPHRHSPLTHVGPVASVHACPHTPQWAGLVRTSTHSDAQQTNAPEQGGSHSDSMHIPPVHTNPGSQALPHVPQWDESVRVSTHAP
jgi:hypothetical protein